MLLLRALALLILQGDMLGPILSLDFKEKYNSARKNKILQHFYHMNPLFKSIMYHVMQNLE